MKQLLFLLSLIFTFQASAQFGLFSNDSENVIEDQAEVSAEDRLEEHEDVGEDDESFYCHFSTLSLSYAAEMNEDRLSCEKIAEEFRLDLLDGAPNSDSMADGEDGDKSCLHDIYGVIAMYNISNIEDAMALCESFESGN